MVTVCAVPALHETVQSQHCALYGHYASDMAQWSAGAIAASTIKCASCHEIVRAVFRVVW